jgi:hypothetical protein
MNDYRKPEKRRPLVSGIILLCLGLWLLWLDTDWMPPLEDAWPLILVIIGLAIMVSAFLRKPRGTSQQNQPPFN